MAFFGNLLRWRPASASDSLLTAQQGNTQGEVQKASTQYSGHI